MKALLKEVCDRITDGSHNPPAGITSSEYMMLSSKNIDDDSISFVEPRYLDKDDYLKENQRTSIVPGDILMTIVGTIGRVAVVPDDISNICVQRSVAVIKPRKEIVSSRFLMYQLQSSRQLLEREARGVAQKGIYLKQLEKISISVFDIEKQKRIVEILDQVSHLISLRKKELTKLDELVKARFVEMFGDIIRNNKGWPQYVFSDIATSRLGKMLDAKQQTGKYKYPYLANFNVQWFRFELENLNEMDFNEADQLEFQLKDGDLLVCEGGEIGRCAVWHNEVQPCYFQKALHRVRCNSDIVLPDYLARWFQYNCEHGGFASIEGAKATIAHLPGAKLKLLKVTVPSIKLQEQYVSFVAQVDKSKDTVQRGLDKLETLKKALMQEFFG